MSSLNVIVTVLSFLPHMNFVTLRAGNRINEAVPGLFAYSYGPCFLCKIISESPCVNPWPDSFLRAFFLENIPPIDHNKPPQGK